MDQAHGAPRGVRGRFFGRMFSIVGGVALALGAAGCFVEHHYDPPPGPTEIEFGEVRNLGYTCGGPLASWTVANRETGDHGSATCEQPVLFTNLAPGATYTFDIQGFDVNQRLCWQGACSVTAIGRITSEADCSGEIVHLCGL